MVCNRLIADDLLEIFRTLFDARYPIERMVLIDEYDADDERSMQNNNSSAFNFRFIAGTDKLSNHSRGLAVDINPLYNPCVRRRTDGSLFVSPEAARPYADRSREFPARSTRRTSAAASSSATASSGAATGTRSKTTSTSRRGWNNGT